MSLLKVEFLSPTGAVLISRIKQQLVKNRVSGNPGVTLFHLFELTALFLELLPPFNLTSASPQVCQANQRFQALLTRYRKKARSFRFLQRVKEEKLTEQKRKLLREKMSTRANELYWILCGMQQYLTSLLLSSPSPQKGSASERPVFDGFSRKKKKVPTTGEKKQKQGSFAQVLLDLRSRSLLSPNEISSRFQRFRERKPSPPVTSLEKHETFWLLFHVLTLSPYDSSIVQAVFIDQVFSPHFLLGVSETYETKGFMDRLVRRLEEQTKKFQKVRDTQFCVGIFSTLLQNYSKTVEGQVIAEYLETDIYAQSAFFTINCSPLFLDKTNTIRNSMYEDNIRRNPFQKKKTQSNFRV